AADGIDVLELPHAMFESCEPGVEVGHGAPPSLVSNLTNVAQRGERGRPMDFTGKTALITGGVSGIGFGIARAFAGADIRLVLTYRNAGYRDEASEWFRQQRRPLPRFIALDVTDRERWREVADEAGPVHILVNNAGVSVFGATDAASYADYDWIMGV